MDKQLNDLLYGLPPGIDYTEDLTSLDDQDIPLDRIPQLMAILHGDDDEVAFRAAWVLSEWGNQAGFEYMCSFIDRDPTLQGGWYEHRLRGYDDTYRFVLEALLGYWARCSDRSKAAGEIIRKEIFAPTVRLIQLSNEMPFTIEAVFSMVESFGMTEFLPSLKSHLQAIIKDPQKHHWKVADCAHMLMNFDPEFVTQTLAAHGYTLGNFPNK
jgi:hypothetical protein